MVNKSGRRGIYDELKCKNCGLTGRSYHLGTIEVSERDRNRAYFCKGVSKMAKDYVKVIRCTASGLAFSNLTPGSIHKVIDPPVGENKDRGEWVMGVGEPVLLLFREFNYVENPL